MILIGTSGYNYPEWKGSFYPPDLPASKMLPYYAERLCTVEINYSFYRLPSEKAVEGWAAATPDNFTFTLKAPRRITHDARLRDCDDILQVFGKRARSLGSKLGVLLFQLPPSFRKDLEALDSLLDWVPPDLRAAPWSSGTPPGTPMMCTPGSRIRTSLCASPTTRRGPPHWW